MMHTVHAPITTPVPLGLDSAHTSAACDTAGDASGTVWYTLVDFIRTVVEARAARTAPSPGTPGEGWGGGRSRSTTRSVSH